MTDSGGNVKTVVGIQLGLVGVGVGKGVQRLVVAEVADPMDWSMTLRNGEDWRGDARQHQRRLRNRTHRRILS